jgi:GNAT superfamily N-acetyltransferase
MSRRLRALTVDGVAGLDRSCSTCVYWESSERLEVRCGSACDEERLRSCFSDVRREWGEYGRMALEDKTVLGFIKCAPARYFPQARRLPVGAPDASAPLVTCLHVRDEARCKGLDRVLLQAVLRDLHMRGERSVYAYGSVSGDVAESPMPELEFLLEQGFTIERPHLTHPLLRLDLRTLAAWTENLEAALESLLLPLGRGGRVPTPSVD